MPHITVALIESEGLPQQKIKCPRHLFVGKRDKPKKGWKSKGLIKEFSTVLEANDSAGFRFPWWTGIEHQKGYRKQHTLYFGSNYYNSEDFT